MYPHLIRIFLLFLLLFTTGMVMAQQKVVLRTPLNRQLKPLPNEKFASAIEERWKEDGIWKAKLINNETGKVMAEYGYADSTRNTKHGLHIEYLPNRKKRFEQTYKNGELDGPFTEWYPDGILKQKGNQTGTKLWGHYENYFADGSLKYVCDGDMQGNGTGKEYLPKVGVSGEGMVKSMQQTGTWIYKDSTGTKVMEVVYNEKGIAQETCFDANGNPITGAECISDRRPEFPGGEDAWIAFLKKNLTYPKSAMKAQIQGSVLIKFMVKEDGSLSGFKILESPDPELAAEAMRVMRLSPKWKPSIEFNKIVPFTHVESITFQLK